MDRYHGESYKLMLHALKHDEVYFCKDVQAVSDGVVFQHLRGRWVGLPPQTFEPVTEGDKYGVAYSQLPYTLFTKEQDILKFLKDNKRNHED